MSITEQNNGSSGPVDVPTSTDQDAALVKRLLGNIEATFKDAEKTGALYNVNNQPANTSTGNIGKDDLSHLEESVRSVSKKRQKFVGVRDKFRWVFRDKKAFQELVARVGRPQSPPTDSTKRFIGNQERPISHHRISGRHESHRELGC